MSILILFLNKKKTTLFIFDRMIKSLLNYCSIYVYIYIRYMCLYVICDVCFLIRVSLSNLFKFEL